MKFLPIVFCLSLVITTLTLEAYASEVLVEKNNHCVSSLCIIEALKDHKGNEIIVSGPDYGSGTPRSLYLV